MFLAKYRNKTKIKKGSNLKMLKNLNQSENQIKHLWNCTSK